MTKRELQAAVALLERELEVRTSQLEIALAELECARRTAAELARVAFGRDSMRKGAP
jgi:hypothetical protein